MARREREEEESAEVEGQSEECPFISLKISSKMAFRFQHFNDKK
jgi:hypothetical protein